MFTSLIVIEFYSILSETLQIWAKIVWKKKEHLEVVYVFVEIERWIHTISFVSSSENENNSSNSPFIVISDESDALLCEIESLWMKRFSFFPYIFRLHLKNI